MLKKIKSSVIIRKIFVLINPRYKLNLVLKNKVLQKILNINLTDIRRISGRYIIYESKIKGKEYDGMDDKLIYEGGYLNGKRNGKGKEYFKFNQEYKLYILKFEGEYLNGKRNGKGKEYNEDKKLIYEGEYLNGKRRKGKEYNDKGQLIFEGEYLNGVKWNGNAIDISYGKGKIIIESKYLNGMKYNEIGKEYNETTDFLIFEGEYLNGQKNGKGKLYYYDDKIKFEGEFVLNQRRKGRKYFLNGKLKFEGEYLFNRKWNGKGYDNNGNIIYELINGKGNVIKYHENFILYKEINEKEKESIYEFIIKFEGEYKDGKKNGNGKEYNSDGHLIYEGEYLNGERNGKGKEYSDEGQLVFDGDYINGERDLKGSLFYDMYSY